MDGGIASLILTFKGYIAWSRLCMLYDCFITYGAPGSECFFLKITSSSSD